MPRRRALGAHNSTGVTLGGAAAVPRSSARARRTAAWASSRRWAGRAARCVHRIRARDLVLAVTAAEMMRRALVCCT